MVRQLCRDLHIQTTPYRPVTNGVIERMHQTLGSVLRKASCQGLDWVQQLPFALFALRSAPNRDTLFSPYELVYGRQARTLLDILCVGWVEKANLSLDVYGWGELLSERLELMRDLVRERMEKASGERKKHYDKKNVQRELHGGDSVRCRIPGMDHKLKEVWHGPYQVVERINAVDYKANLGRSRKHVYNMKRHFDRENEVLRLTVVAEDFSQDKDKGVRLKGECKGFMEVDIVNVKCKFAQVFDDMPGITDVYKLVIDTGESRPIVLPPYRVPDKLKEDIREEIAKLQEADIIVPTDSPWVAPIVPVPKPDG